jgi:hypothetical protein
MYNHAVANIHCDMVHRTSAVGIKYKITRKHVRLTYSLSCRSRLIPGYSGNGVTEVGINRFYKSGAIRTPGETLSSSNILVTDEFLCVFNNITAKPGIRGTGTGA